MSQYKLIPDKQQRQSSVSSRLIIIAALGLIFITMMILVGLPGTAQDRASVAPPVPTATPTVIAVRDAWIEARDTCPESPEYKQQVVPGAGLWESPGVKTKPGIVPHGALVGILSESAEWTHVDYGGKRGYVQSFFVVDYDPLKEFRPATGDRYCLLCTFVCTDEDMDTVPITTTVPEFQERTVIYEVNVIGDGQKEGWMMGITYTDEFSNTQQIKGTTPWRYEFKAWTGQSVSVTARNGLNNNRFECKIIINGATVVQNENWGRRKESLCSEVVR